MQLRISKSSLKGLVGLAVFALPAVLASSPVNAAQSYSCMCQGERKSFRASTRYCEHQFNVEQCSQGQYEIVYNAACSKMGCSLPTEEDDADALKKIEEEDK